MRAVVQRVSRASVTVDGVVVGRIDAGLLVLIGVTHSDGVEQCRWLAQKVAALRIFRDDQDKMNLSLLDGGLGALVVSQFTLYGDTRKGRRPSFVAAAAPEVAAPLVERFCEELVAAGVPDVQRGVFGADMKVDLLNDGPVTLVVDTP